MTGVTAGKQAVWLVLLLTLIGTALRLTIEKLDVEKWRSTKWRPDNKQYAR